MKAKVTVTVPSTPTSWYDDLLNRVYLFRKLSSTALMVAATSREGFQLSFPNYDSKFRLVSHLFTTAVRVLLAPNSVTWEVKS